MEDEQSVERPLTIVLVCTFIFFVSGIAAIVNLYKIVDGSFTLEDLYYVFLSALMLICAIGIYSMRRAAVYAILILFVVLQLALIYNSKWNSISLLFPLIVLTTSFFHIRKMS
jgi:hypothetical protein